jgi:hypothetical protein
MEIVLAIGVLLIVIIAIANASRSSPPETDWDAQVLSRLKAEMRAGEVSEEFKPILNKVAEYRAKGMSKNEALNTAVARHRKDLEYTAKIKREISEHLDRGRNFDPGPAADAVIAEVERGVDIIKALRAAIPGAVMAQVAAVSAEIKQRQMQGTALPDAIRAAISNFSSRK